MLLISIVFMSLAAFSAGEIDPIIQAKYETLPRDEFIEYFNSLGHSYEITKYEEEPVISKVLFNPELLKNLSVIEHVESEDLPDNFDARQKWTNCATIGEIYNQGRCGSCWTFGTATAASDRICIFKNTTVRLSEEDYECLSNNVCEGGYPDEAYNYWIQTGLVTQECKPYDIPELRKRQCVQKCVNGKDYQADKIKGSSQKQLNQDDVSIKTELFKNGPIQAAFKVYQDFTTYSRGIYTHKYGKFLGGHSVRVLGYGVENGVKYWLAANSWGNVWGENGYFRIKRFIDCGFESGMLAPFP